uniref:Uncharacterized protein n=1 Tax=Aegilops tauschii subsp. strangulata TaxID=200361 RepID=A0A452ZVM6_AEGTS
MVSFYQIMDQNSLVENKLNVDILKTKFVSHFCELKWMCLEAHHSPYHTIREYRLLMFIDMI